MKKGETMPQWLKDKVSKAKKGVPNLKLRGKSSWIKGYHHSEETRRKIGLANSLKIRTEEQKQHLRLLRLGTKLTEEHKRKLSQNNAHYWLGKKRPDIMGHRVSKRTIEHIRNFNKGKFGENHPGWKKFKKHPFHKAIRDLHKYREWRLNVFVRDNFSCVICSKPGGVEADHHPKRFIQIIRENNINTIEKAINCNELWDMTNGRTLCQECHRKTETWGRRMN